MMDLKKIAKEIREIISQKQKDLQLTFEEESHKYTMLDLNGNLRSDFPSVSKVMKIFYDDFPTEQAAYNKAGGDPDEAERLMEEWAEAGRKSTNLGSRCHFFLEEHTLKEFGIDKLKAECKNDTFGTERILGAMAYYACGFDHSATLLGEDWVWDATQYRRDTGFTKYIYKHTLSRQ